MAHVKPLPTEERAGAPVGSKLRSPEFRQMINEYFHRLKRKEEDAASVLNLSDGNRKRPPSTPTSPPQDKRTGVGITTNADKLD